MASNDNEFDWGTDEVVNNQPQSQVQNNQRQQVTQQPQRTGVVPNPNQQVRRVNGQQPNYNQGRNTNQRGVTPEQRQAQRQQAINHQVNQQNVQRHQNNQSSMQQVNQQVNIQQMQQQVPVQEQVFEGQETPRQKKPIGKIILALIVLVIIGLVAVKLLGKKPEIIVSEPYEKSGRFAYDNLLTNLNNFNAEALDDCVGTEDGDSYLAQEYAYVNGVPLREEFIEKVCKIVKFNFPDSTELLDAAKNGGKEEAGGVDVKKCMMNNGESVSVVIPDYEAITVQMNEDVEYITNMMTTSGYTVEDYTYNDDMVNLLCQYVCDLGEIPTKQVELTLPIGTGVDGSPNISDDSAIDDLLFGSKELRNMCATFSQICVGYTGFKDEQYETEEEQDNPEWEKWNKLFEKYYEEDNGIFNENTSKWEPWYLRDAEDNFILDENGEKIVNYYSVKDDKGKDWIEPDKKVMVRVTKTRQVEDKWVEETGIHYNWIGTHYLQTEYDGEFSTYFRVGDGSIEHPAGVGTSIITKVLCTDGNYHDVRVTLMGYWVDQNAIDYAESFSTKNKGFTTQSVIRMICYEVEVENLEKQPITFQTTEMTLCDSNSNVTARTGTLYGFTSETTLQAGEKKFVNDWGASTELDQKYVCWGKSFGRTFPMVYFNILAGTGEIPPYSAYELFNGKSSIDDSVSTGANTTETSTEATPSSTEASK